MFPGFKNKALNPWQPGIFSRLSDTWASGTTLPPSSIWWSLASRNFRKTGTSSLCCYAFVYLTHTGIENTQRIMLKPPQQEKSCLTGEAFGVPQKGQFICTRPYFHPQSPFISSDLAVTLRTQLVCNKDDPVSDVTDVVVREREWGQLVIMDIFPEIKTSGRCALRR